MTKTQTKKKSCSTCKVTQPLSNYHKKAQNKVDGHTNVCKSCCKAYGAKWRKENADKVREDKAKDYLNNIDKYKTRAVQWKRENRYKATASNAKRRAGRASPTTNHDDARGMYKLSRKLNELTGGDLQVDHIEPLVHSDICGLHTGVNLQLLASKVNATKGNRRDFITPIESLRNYAPTKTYSANT